MAETTPDTVYELRNVPKTYTNFSGIELPERGMQGQTFLKPLLRMGNSTTAVSLGTSGIPPFELYTTTALAAGTLRNIYSELNLTGDTAANIEALYVQVISEEKTGSWVNAIVGRIDFGTDGDARNGMAAPLCGELNFPAKALNGGVYTVLDLEIEAPTSFVHDANAALPKSFIRFGLWGAAAGEIDDHGYLFHLDGVTAGDGDLFDTSQDVDGVRGDASLKININGTEYWIPLCDNEALT